MAEQRDVIWNLRTTVTGREQAAQLADTIDRTDKEFRDASKGAQEFENATRKASAASGKAAQETQKQAASIGRLGVTVKQAVAAFVGFAGISSIMVGVRRTVEQAAATIVDFDQEIANLSALTGATGGDLDFLRQKAIDLGSSTSLSANEVAQAFTKIASARPQLLEDADALNFVTEASIRLAEASGEDLVSATTAAVGALNQFGLETEDITGVVDTLAAGSKFGAANVANLGETINRVGTVLSEANIDIARGVGLIETLAEREIKGAEAGTQLRNVILRLQKAGKGFVDGQFDVVAALQQVKEEFEAIEDPVQRSEAAIKLFETRGITAGTILLENIERIDYFTDRVQESGIAAEQQATRMATLSGALERLRSAWTGVVLSFSGGNGALRESIDFIARNLSNIFNIFRIGVRVLIAYLAATQGVALASRLLGAATRFAATQQSILGVAITRSTVSLRIFNATVKASPLGLFIGLLTAAYSAYTLFIDGAKEASEEQREVNKALQENLQLRERLRTQDVSIDQRADQVNKLNKEQLQQLTSDIDLQIEQYERLAAEAVGAEAAKADAIQDERERQSQLDQTFFRAVEENTSAADAALLARLATQRDSAYAEQRAKFRALNGGLTEDEANAQLERLRNFRSGIDERISELERLERAEQNTINGLLALQKELQEKLKAEQIGSAQFFATDNELKQVEARIEAAKALLEGITKGSLADLQRQRDALLKRLKNELLQGSTQYQEVFALYVELARKVKEAEEALRFDDDPAVAGSLRFFEEEVTRLTNAIKEVPEGEEFDALLAKLEQATADLNRFKDRLKFETPEERAKRVRDGRLAELDEEKRHTLAIAELDDDLASTRIALQLEFERQRLRILEESGTATEAELTAQRNKIRELELGYASAVRTEGDEALSDLANLAIESSAVIAQAGINAWSAWSEAQQNAYQQQYDQQQRRVEEARELAEKGNAALLEEEQKRLRRVTEERRRAAEQQSAIAQAEVFANSAVAIARAAAEGGGFASAVTIGATVIALIAGLARARQLSSGLSFRKGGLFDGGYTGHGNPDAVSTALGPRPYEYHKREFIMPHEVVSVGNNLKWMDRIYRGRLDMDKLFGKAQAQGGTSGMSDRQVSRMVGAMKSAPGVTVMLDKNGFSTFVGAAQRRRARRNSRL